jgi:glycerophosphoryl diester phosphodiesterase
MRFETCLPLVALILAAGTPANSQQSDVRPTPKSHVAKSVVVIAHRGAHREAPENSLAALNKAIEIGCDYVEVDVRRTKDGVLVIMHDSSVNRMTDGKGKIEDLTLEEIRKLHFKKKGDWVAEKVPTFDEILDKAKGRMKIYVDHKNALPAEVLAAIEKHGMLAEVVVYGSVGILREYKRLAPKVWIMPDHPRSIAQIEALAKDLKPETLDGSIVRWSREEMEAAHRAGIEVWVDNVPARDNEAGIKNAVEMGVDAIQTDNPALVLDVLVKMGRHTPVQR